MSPFQAVLEHQVGGEGNDGHGAAWENAMVCIKKSLFKEVTWRTDIQISTSVWNSVYFEYWYPTMEQAERWMIDSKTGFFERCLKDFTENPILLGKRVATKISQTTFHQAILIDEEYEETLEEIERLPQEFALALASRRLRERKEAGLITE